MDMFFVEVRGGSRRFGMEGRVGGSSDMTNPLLMFELTYCVMLFGTDMGLACRHCSIRCSLPFQMGLTI